MKVIGKSVLATLAIVLLFCIRANAQDAQGWTILPYLTAGDGGEKSENVFRSGVGIDGKYNFHKYWSVLAGIEYEYRYGKGENFVQREGLKHIFRFPVRAEFTYGWFYINLGPYIERATNTRFSDNETVDFGFGGMTEIGGRARVSKKDHVRLGVQSQYCFYKGTLDGQSYFGGNGYWAVLGIIAYEHHF